MNLVSKKKQDIDEKKMLYNLYMKYQKIDEKYTKLIRKCGVMNIKRTYCLII